ncbi:hypothetical protein KP509_14G028100 [Ceratopteris richardii]|uniref:Uncharacterized protein n=1 Tax=Ceratopteris richardii TaxID=49495 RepID=A0A8T2TAG7_CERRI|nr:hypothetical protein KP509_14G028100 [Ceratopteris richardii]KAH7415115.1 hypothetical protein KP509_14G028100 [Ceratopteris richardii]
MTISGKDAAMRRSTELFTPALGIFGENRLNRVSDTMAPAGPDLHDVGGEPILGNANREVMHVRGEDLAGLYAGVGRLSSAGLEGGSTVISHPGIMNVGLSSSTVARCGMKPAMISFVEGDFRLHTVGTVGRTEVGDEISSIQPLLRVMTTGIVDEGKGHEDGAGAAASEMPSIEAPWQHRIASTHEAQQPVRSVIERQQLAGASLPTDEDSNMDADRSGAAGEQHPHQQSHHLHSLRSNEREPARGSRDNIAELDQQSGHHHQRLEEPHHHQKETAMRSQNRGTLTVVVEGTEISAGGGVACHDCGNQAKKDCPHMRCRTCCKSRGFECATHVKSTWVPMSKRRQRQLQQAGLIGSTSHTSEESLKLARMKRARTLSLTTADTTDSTVADARLHHDRQLEAAPSFTSTSTDTPTRSSDINSAGAVLPPKLSQGQMKHDRFPPEFKMQAVFRCLRITGVMDGQTEYGYQTEIQVGGHTFKGILYDQGTEKTPDFMVENLGDLQLGGSNTLSSTPTLMNISRMYASPDRGALLGGFR